MLNKFGVHLKCEKCKFFVPVGIHLVHKINRGAIEPAEDRAEVIKYSPHLRKFRELQTRLGKLN